MTISLFDRPCLNLSSKFHIIVRNLIFSRSFEVLTICSKSYIADDYVSTWLTSVCVKGLISPICGCHKSRMWTNHILMPNSNRVEVHTMSILVLPYLYTNKLVSKLCCMLKPITSYLNCKSTTTINLLIIYLNSMHAPSIENCTGSMKSFEFIRQQILLWSKMTATYRHYLL